MQNERYYSNGKLLISGEYLVLHGATSLAVPLKVGQDLQIKKLNLDSNPKIIWESQEFNQSWFEVELLLNEFIIQQTSNTEIADRLTNYLKKAKELNPQFLSNNQNIKVKTNLSFKKEWGFGSSSTLINNLADWANIDAYTLLNNTMGGSGFDIACAKSEQPIFYQKHDQGIEVAIAPFNPTFRNHLYFVYLGKKQNSSLEIQRFNKLKRPSSKVIEEISALAKLMAETKNQNEFNQYIIAHEDIISSVLKLKAVKQKKFSDFNGEIKSLGAWGGDFVMVSSNDDFQKTKKYFSQKGLKVIFKFADLIK